MKPAAIALATALLAAACAARLVGPPEVVLDRSACSHCGMLISEQVYAAALRTSDGREQVFDDLGCLLAALHDPSTAGARIWVHDAARGGWIDGRSAAFVTSPALRTPMSGRLVAFADRASALRAAAELRNSVVTSLDALLADKEGRK